MDFDSELAEQLLGGVLPIRTRKDICKKEIAQKVVKSISGLLSLDSDCSLNPVQDYLHFWEIFDLYESWRAMPTYSEIDCHTTRKIAGYLLKMCHFWWLDNLYIVNRIVGYYHRSHGDYREIIYGVIDHTPSWKTLFSWGKWLPPSRVDHSGTDNSPLLYFLITYNRYSLVVHGRAFVDQPILSNGFSSSPCEDCFINAEPNKLLLLLQYGASISGVDCRKRMEAFCCFCLMHEMVSSLWLHAGCKDNEQPNAFSSEYSKKKLECGKIIMRVMPQITMFREFRFSQDVIKRLLILNGLGYFPDVTRRFKDPCELKHLSRLYVRFLVQHKCIGGLPGGISSLGLPHHLIDYLNIQED